VPKPEAEPPLRIWALTGARAGDNDQVIALAEAIGLPFEIKQLQYNRFRFLGPRLIGRSLLSLTRASREAILGTPPPDLTISAGHRSVAVVQALRHRSGGRTRSIHVGFPRISPGGFDLVIATPQYPIADHPNLLRVPYALTSIATTVASSADMALLDSLPTPRRLLIVGGPTLFWNLDEASLIKSLEIMVAQAASDGGSVLVTTSPRTPRTVTEAVTEALYSATVPTLLTGPGQVPRYASLLGAADSIRLTADSVSMASDAIWTGKPVALVPIAKSPFGRAVFAMADRLRPGRRVYPQDLRFFWRALSDIGVSETLAIPGTSTGAQIREVLKRVQPILEALRERRLRA
jgi:mitochondrial fission protein ELM1